MKDKFKTYLLLTGSILLMAVGVYFFKFPNKFSFGGVSAYAIVLAQYMPVSAGTINFVISMALLVVGFLALGREFGLMTAYASILFSVSLSAFEWLFPLAAPLTNQPLLELCYAIALPAVASAVLFHIGASSGGTDIIAMMMKKYTHMDIGIGLIVSEVVVVAASFFVFNVQTGLFSLAGLLVRSLMIDNVIENINLCKYFTVICDNPEPICNYIVNDLKRGATICEAKGAFTHGKKWMVMAVLKRPQAMLLRTYVKQVEPHAFILITNTSEIIGKGFQSS